MISVSIQQVTNTSSWAILVLLYLNLLAVCTFDIVCASYLPTLSYLATFRGYDTFFVFTITAYCFMLVPMFLSFHVRASKVLKTDEIIFMALFEITIIVLGITVSLIDEINGIEFNPVDNLHVYLSFGLSIICFSWVYYALKFLEKTELTNSKKEKIQECWLIYKVAWALYIVTLLEWHFAYTIYNCFIANTLIETICEWTLITLALRFPVKISEITDNSLFFIQTNKKNSN